MKAFSHNTLDLTKYSNASMNKNKYRLDKLEKATDTTFPSLSDVSTSLIELWCRPSQLGLKPASLRLTQSFWGLLKFRAARSL